MNNHLNEFEFNLLRVIFISEKKQGTKEIFLPSATKFLKIHSSFASPYIPHDTKRYTYFQGSKLKRRIDRSFHRKPPTNYSIIVCRRPLRWLHGPTCTKQIRSRLHRYEARVNVEPLYLQIPFPYLA